MVLFYAKRNMVKKTISIFLISLFVVSSLFSTTNVVEAQTTEYYNPATGENVRTSDYTDSYYNPSTGTYSPSTEASSAQACPSGIYDESNSCVTISTGIKTVSLNTANEALAKNLADSGCSAVGGAVSSTLSSLGQQLLSSAGVNGLGAKASGSVNDALGGGVIGNAAGKVAGQVGSALENTANGVMKNVAQTATKAADGAINSTLDSINGQVGVATGGLNGVVQNVVGSADKIVTSVLSSDLLSGVVNNTGSMLVNLGAEIGSGSLVSLGNTLGGMSAGYTAGELGSMFSGAGSALPGIGNVLSLLGGGGTVPTDPQTIVKQINTLQQDTSTLKTKQTCLDRIAYTSSRITISKMQENEMKWLNTGNNGNPLYLTNFNDYLSKQAQNQTRIFVSDLSKTNSPYREENIKAVIASQQSETASSRIAKYEDPLTKAIGSTNAAKYRNGDTSVCSSIKCFVLASQNNVAANYLRVSEDLGSSLSKAEEAAKIEAKDGVPPIKECLDTGSDVVPGACRKTKITTPASTIEERLRAAATAPSRNVSNIGANSNEDVSPQDRALAQSLAESSFYSYTDNNLANNQTNKTQEINSLNDIVASIDNTTNAFAGYLGIRNETLNVASAAASTTSALIAFSPATYCPSTLASQLSSPSLFAQQTYYNDLISKLEREINAISLKIIPFAALKEAITSGKTDFQTASYSLVAISGPDGIPTPDMAGTAASQFSEVKAIRDTAMSAFNNCQSEHQAILEKERLERERLNQTTYY